MPYHSLPVATTSEQLGQDRSCAALFLPLKTTPWFLQRIPTHPQQSDQKTALGLPLLFPVCYYYYTLLLDPWSLSLSQDWKGTAHLGDTTSPVRTV